MQLQLRGRFTLVGADFLLVVVIFAITAPSPALRAVIGACIEGFLGCTATELAFVSFLMRAGLRDLLCDAAFTGVFFFAGAAFFETAFLAFGLCATAAFLGITFFATFLAEVFFDGAAFFTAAFFAGAFFFAADFFCAINPPS
ncbi:MAG: hypothetical protein HQL08_07270 [Nitrospirae bacterium]|nr:hypothetical protein [Nitrospirota bacterium]